MRRRERDIKRGREGNRWTDKTERDREAVWVRGQQGQTEVGMK